MKLGNNKMKYFVIFSLVLTGFSVISIENAFGEKCLPIELEYKIDGGVVTELCKSDTNIQVNAKIQASDKGKLIIEIPKNVVYSLSGLNCELGELFVLMNGYEILPDNVTDGKNHNIITISFQEGNHTLAFVGSTILPKPGPSDYCGIVMGYDSLYLPPKFQEKKEVSLKHIRCNDGLVVLAKYDGSPACVKPETKEKLIERGWTIADEVGAKEAISLIKKQYPQLQDFPSNNLPPKVIRVEKSSSGVYLIFETQGSGIPIIEARCFFVDNENTITVIGQYKPEIGDMKTNISFQTCN